MTLALLDKIMWMLMLPHFRSFEINVLLPTQKIINESEPNAAVAQIRKWLKSRRNEVSYIQVAGAVMFASVNSCLSWTDLPGHHWSAPACWYASIMLALTSIVLGAQQYMVLDCIQPQDWSWLRDALKNSDSGRAKRSFLFVWQLPLMTLSYSMVFFVAGLLSYVISPFAAKRVWDDDAKILVLFLSVVVAALFAFVGCSAYIHGLLKHQAY